MHRDKPEDARPLPSSHMYRGERNSQRLFSVAYQIWYATPKFLVHNGKYEQKEKLGHFL